MSWQCTSWALREAPAPTATARLVLIALADRCQPDGRSAWPTVDTLAAEAHASVSSVRRALRALEECGAIRRGNQQLAQWDEHGQWVPVAYRPVVWECCMGVALEEVAEKPGRRARAEREERRARHAANPSTDAANGTPMRGVKMTRLENGGNRPIPRGVKMTPLHDEYVERPSTGDTPDLAPVTGLYKETNIKQILPPAPTGHPPQGDTPRKDTKPQTRTDEPTPTMPTEPTAPADCGIDAATPTLWSPPEPEADPDPRIDAAEPSHEPRDGHSGDATGNRPPFRSSDDDAERLLGLLAVSRETLGLSATATPADRRAVARWLASWPATRPSPTLIASYVATSRYWLKRIRSGRDLARHASEIADDMLTDQAFDTNDATSGPRSVEERALLHADRLLARLDLDGRVETKAKTRLACLLADRPDAMIDDRAARPLVDEAVRHGRRLVRDQSEELRRRRAEETERRRANAEALARYRAEHGGSCFAGLRGKETS